MSDPFWVLDDNNLERLLKNNNEFYASLPNNLSSITPAVVSHLLSKYELDNDSLQRYLERGTR